jgi:hypothetical protein
LVFYHLIPPISRAKDVLSKGFLGNKTRKKEKPLKKENTFSKIDICHGTVKHETMPLLKNGSTQINI